MIAIIAILAAMLLPALSKAKTRAQCITCMNSRGQITKAVLMYTVDNYDYFPPNPDDGNTDPGYNWCCGDVSGGMPPGTESSPDMTNPDILLNPNLTLVAPYLAGNYLVWKCPADPRYYAYQGSNPTMRGMSIPTVRSTSMNQGVGTVDHEFLASGSGHAGPPVFDTNGPWLNGSHSHTAGHPYETFGKTAEFGRASSSTIFMVVDENPYSINDAGLAVIAETHEAVDFPSDLHANACGFGFCDGHAEIHKWASDFYHLTEGASERGVDARIPGQLIDWKWMATHATINIATGAPIE